MAKGGLGRGLNSLVATAAEESGSNAIVNELPIDKIEPNPNQPRTDFDDIGIQELAASINKEGLLQPILVRPNGDTYQIIAGERRWWACKSLNFKTIPVKVMPISETKTLEIALIENLQRANLNPVEEARGYKALVDKAGMTQAQIAESVSKSRVAIANSMRLLALPDEIQEMMFAGSISAGHGRAILALNDEDKMIALAQKVVANNLSVRETENLTRLYAAGEVEREKRVPSPRSYKLVAKKLRQQLEANVRVKSVRGKNKIEIEFKDEDDLERVFKRISGADITTSFPTSTTIDAD